MGINKATKQRAALEEAVVATIASEPALLQKVRSGTLNVLQVEKDILATITASNVERARLQAYARPLARSLYSRGARTSAGGATMRGMPGGAGGFVPNFANAGGERMAAAAGGYRAGSIRTMAQPGVGTMMYNSAETVKRFPGMSQSAIMPPQGSPAGAGYGAAFSAAHGFDPYTGSGFVPNFVKAKTKSKAFNPLLTMNNVAQRDIGIIMGQGSTSTATEFSNTLKQVPQLYDAIRASGTYAGLLSGAPIKGYGRGKSLGPNTKFLVRGVPAVTMFPMSQAEADRHAQGQEPSTMNVLSGALNRYKNQVATKLWGSTTKADDNAGDFNIKRLSKGTAGDIFEEAVRASTPKVGSGKFIRTEAFDFDGPNYAPKQLIKFLNNEGANLLPTRTKIEAKIGNEAAKGGNIPKKIINDLIAGRKGKRVGPYAGPNGLFAALAGSLYRGKALGYVPNFSPLSSAIGREMQAGIPASAIRVGSSSALRSAGNPGGVGVYNTIDEPSGLSQGISRSASQGIDPRFHGAAAGMVPNFRRPPWNKDMNKKQMDEYRRGLKKGDQNTEALNKLTNAVNDNSGKIMGAAVALSYIGGGAGEGKGGALMQTGTNVAMMGMMGGMMGFGAPGVVAGIGLGLYQSMDKLMDAFDPFTIEMNKFKDELKASAMVAKDFASKLAGAEQAFMKFAENYGGMTGSRAAEETVELMSLFAQADQAKGGSGDYTKRGAALIRKVQEGTYGASDAKELNALIRSAEKNAARDQQAQSLYGEGGWYEKMGERGLFSTKTTSAKNVGDLGTQVGRMGGFRQSVIRMMSEEGLVAGGLSPQELIARAVSGDTRLPTPSRIKRGEFSGRGDMFLDTEIMRDSIADMRKSFAGDYKAEEKATKIKGVKTIFRPPQSEYDTGSFEENKLVTDKIRAQYRQEGRQEFDRLLEKAMLDQFGGRSGLERAVESYRKSAAKGVAGPPDFGPLMEFGMGKRRTSVLGGIGAAGDLKRAKMTNAEALALKNAQRKGRLDVGRVSLRKGDFSQLQFDEAITAAEDTRLRTVGDAKADRTKSLEGLIKDIQGGVAEAALGGTAFQERKPKAFVDSLTEMEESLLKLAKDPEALSKELTRLMTVTKKSADTAGIRGAKMKILDKLHDKSIGIQATFNQQQITASQQKDAEILLAKFEKDVREKNIEAIKKFYSGKHLEALEDERTILQGKIEHEKEAVQEGKLHNDVLNKSINRFEELNQVIDGTGNVFGQALVELRQAAYGDLAPMERRREGGAAADKLGGVLRGRRRGAAGAQELLGTGDPQRMFRQGLITADEYRQILQASRGDKTTASPMAVFREEFLYGGRDHMVEFESGVVNVANTMKSSFADAFKSISSGAATGKEAIVAFADGILNSISDVSANMATNMMFSRLFPTKSEGGYIPRFQGGGVVTGGSGVRDDVPAMMSGGEYVIRKSAAQKSVMEHWMQ